MNKYKVDFHGYLQGPDHPRLTAADIYYVSGNSEVGPSGEIRAGYARNVVEVSAESESDAIARVRTALAGLDCSEWNAREVSDDGVVRSD